MTEIKFMLVRKGSNVLRIIVTGSHQTLEQFVEDIKYKLYEDWAIA